MKRCTENSPRNGFRNEKRIFWTSTEHTHRHARHVSRARLPFNLCLLSFLPVRVGYGQLLVEKHRGAPRDVPLARSTKISPHQFADSTPFRSFADLLTPCTAYNVGCRFNARVSSPKSQQSSQKKSQTNSRFFWSCTWLLLLQTET